MELLREFRLDCAQIVYNLNTMELYKTTIVIWSEYDPSSDELDIENLARDAVCGEAYCSYQHTEFVPDTLLDPDWDNNEFFGVLEDLKIGDEVKMPEPNNRDDWYYSFVGNYIGMHGEYAQVQDGEGEVWYIEPYRLKIL